MNASTRRRLAERAAEEGLLDVAYTTTDSPFGPLLLARTAQGLVRVGLPGQDADELLLDLSARVSPRVLEAPAELDEARRELDLYFEGKLDRFDLPLDWQTQRRLPSAGAAGDRPRSPTAQTRNYTEMAVEGRQRARRPRRRHRLRQQPDPAGRPLPPGAAQRRRPRRLRRRPADEAGAAGARGRAGREFRVAKGFPRPLRQEGHAPPARPSTRARGIPLLQARLVGGVRGHDRPDRPAQLRPLRRRRDAGRERRRTARPPPRSPRSNPKKKRKKKANPEEVEECEEVAAEEFECAKRRRRREDARPPTCKLTQQPAPARSSRHRHGRLRLTIHYIALAPATVAVAYWLRGSRGSLKIDGERQRFAGTRQLPRDRASEPGADDAGAGGEELRWSTVHAARRARLLPRLPRPAPRSASRGRSGRTAPRLRRAGRRQPLRRASRQPGGRLGEARGVDLVADLGLAVGRRRARRRRADRGRAGRTRPRSPGRGCRGR